MAYDKVFVDVNILIDIFNKNSHNHINSTQTITALTENNITLYTSCDIVTTIYYVLNKGNKLKSLKQIEHINQLCVIIEFSNHELEQAVQLMQTDSDYHDLEDTIQYILAQKSACDLIISNDKKFSSKDIKLLSTTEFLALNL